MDMINCKRANSVTNIDDFNFSEELANFLKNSLKDVDDVEKLIKSVRLVGMVNFSDGMPGYTIYRFWDTIAEKDAFSDIEWANMDNRDSLYSTGYYIYEDLRNSLLERGFINDKVEFASFILAKYHGCSSYLWAAEDFNKAYEEDEGFTDKQLAEILKALKQILAREQYDIVKFELANWKSGYEYTDIEYQRLMTAHQDSRKILRDKIEKIFMS